MMTHDPSLDVLNFDGVQGGSATVPEDDLTVFLKRALRIESMMGLRQRHLYTKANRLRLRYILPVSITMIAAGIFVFSLIDLPSSDVSDGLSVQADLGQSAQSVAVDSDGSVVIGGANQIQSLVSEGIRQAAFSLKKAAKPRDHVVKVASGGTIAGAMQDVGVSGTDAYYVVKALSEYFDPRKVKAGQEFEVKMKPVKASDSDEMDFEKMVFKISPVEVVTVIKKDDAFEAELVKKKLVIKEFAKAAEIETSLYGSAARAGIPAQIIAEVIRAYSWDVDFQRDIRRGDKLQVLYSTQETEDGDFAGYGDVAYASLTIGGKDKPIYRYETKDGRVDYYEADGRSVKKTLMKTPIDGARLSSGFGMRRHPVLGYNKMHKGTDFAAATGTPIYAAGDGVVDYAGRKGGYGNYIRLRHNGSLKTAYAHMHKFASKMSVGKRVEQGQVIGYVGTTGRSTGPHLHYEVLLNGAQVNPNRVDLPVGEKLAGDEMSKFKALSSAVRKEYESLSDEAG